ncbi:MAG: phosphopyruvate hydratase [Patescibacteria group bacterium]
MKDGSINGIKPQGKALDTKSAAEPRDIKPFDPSSLAHHENKFSRCRSLAGIKKISGYEIKDSTGKPTLKVVLESNNFTVTSFVPRGQSTGSLEAAELRDEDGGMKKAIEIIATKISPALVGKKPDQKQIDDLLISLDGTKNKSVLGGNTTIGISMAVAMLRAEENGLPLWKNIAEENKTSPKMPSLFMNIINGGVHANFRLPFQEYMIVIREKSAKQSFQVGQEIFKNLGEIIKTRFGNVPFGDEGGYSPICEKIEEPFSLLEEASGRQNVFFAIDSAASEFFKNGSYNILGKSYSPDELLNLYKYLTSKFRLKSIEDPFEESSETYFKKIVGEIGKDTIIVGDDLTVTNPERISKLSKEHAANAVIIKPNQIGTVSEVFEAVRLAHKAGWKTIVSHRSGDTPDSFIADLAVGLGTYGIKAGSPNPPERKAKYERLIEIEKEMKIDQKIN